MIIKLLAVIAVACSVWVVARAAGAQELCDVRASANVEEQAFRELLNDYRLENGAPALLPSATLDRATSWHIADMDAADYVAHQDSLGRSPSERAADCGYSTWVGEIAAGGFNSARDVFDAFRSSPSHNAIMLDPAYRVAGVSYSLGDGYGWWSIDVGVAEEFSEGWNPLTWPGPVQWAGEVMAAHDWEAVAGFDGARWQAFYRSAPLGSLNSLLFVVAQRTYWVYVWN